MEIECKRVGSVNPSYKMLQSGNQSDQRPKGAVDVKPEIIFPACRGQCIQVVDSSGVHCSRSTDDTERQETSSLIGFDRRPQIGNGDSAVRVHRNRPKGIPAEVSERLSSAMAEIVASEQFKSFMDGRNYGVVWAGGNDFEAYLKERGAAFDAAIKSAGITSK